MSGAKSAGLVIVITALGVLAAWCLRPMPPPPWTDRELALLRSLWIDSLPAPPATPSNAVAADPRAARLGQQLFFDPRLSGNGEVACATCHQPARRFTDGLAKGKAIGTTRRNTHSIVAAVYSPWLYWDGRKDSLWSQALSPLEDPREHGGTRMRYARFIAGDAEYRAAYQALFGRLPDFTSRERFPEAAAPLGDAQARAAWQAMAPADRVAVNTVFANIGKAIAAYERRILPGRSRFDDYVEAALAGDAAAQRESFTDEEVRGLRLFIGDARCTECHNGPLFTNNEFHNTGVLSFPDELPDRGRVDGIRRVLEDPFNCLGDYSDDPERHCPELRFARAGPELVGAMRTPSLRNLAGTGPFMHKGQTATLAAVLDHYNRAPLAVIGHNEAKPLGLGRRELRQLEAFLDTLAAPVAGPAQPGSEAAPGAP